MLLLFNSLLSLFSPCFTHRKKTLPYFHAVHVFCLLFICIYMFISLTFTCFTTNLASDMPNSNSSFPYQPIPCNSVCQCLDSVPFAFFCKTHNLASLGLCSKRHKMFLFSLLLLLSGDVSLNPGPASSSNLNVCSYNIRSATTISNQFDKPALIQDFILDNKIDFCFLTETWLAPDSPSSVLNLLTPDNYCLQHVPRSTGRGVALLPSLSLISLSLLSLLELSPPLSICF